MKNLNEDLTKSEDKVIKESITECEGMHTYVQPIKEYIDELEKTLTRAKKEHELLGLYRSKDMHMEDYYAYGSLRGSQKALDNLRSVREEIEVLEKELEEMKSEK
jgi:hypothetical protein